MASSVEDIIRELTNSNEKESFNKIHNILVLRKLPPKIIVKIVRAIEPHSALLCKKKHISRLWDVIINKYFEDDSKIKTYFNTFLFKTHMNITEKNEYNLNVVYTVLEKCNEEENVVLKEILSVLMDKLFLLTKALKEPNVNSSKEMYRKFVHYYLLPEVFSRGLNKTDKKNIMSLIRSEKMGYFADRLSTEEKTKLKINIITVYLPAIAPELEIPEWWDYCKLLIYYCGTYLHSEIQLTNAILRRVEFGFQVKTAESRSGSYECWKTLIKNYHESPSHLRNPKQISLLLKPLKAKFSRISTVSVKRFEVFATFIACLENSSPACMQEFLNFCYGPFGTEYKRPGALQNQHFPGRLTTEMYPRSLGSLLWLLGHECQLDNCYKHLPSGKDADVVLKQFLTPHNVKEHGEMFVNSVTVCSLLLIEWLEDATIVHGFIKCLWTELFKTIKESESFPAAVLQSVVRNIKMICKTIETSNIFEDVLNEILKVILKLVSNSAYCSSSQWDQFFIPVICELYRLEVKVPGCIKFESETLFNSVREPEQLYSNLKPFLDSCFTPVKSSFILNMYKFAVKNTHCHDTLLDLLLSFLDNDSEICFDMWKVSFNMQVLKAYPALKNCLIDTIKEKMLNESGLKNINILKLLELFFPFITKKDQSTVNNIIVSIRYSLLMLPKREVPANINILQKLLNIKWKMNFDNNNVFCICFVDLLKQEVYSVLPILKCFLQKLDTDERRDARLHMEGALKNLVKSNNEQVSSEAASLLKLLDEGPVAPAFVSRGAKIRNMITNQQSKKAFDLSELSDADFVKIDAEVFVDPNKMSDHQKEVASRRRDDIPALYEDLTQSSMDSILNQKGNGVAGTDGGEDNNKRKRGEEIKDDVEDKPKFKKVKSDTVPDKAISITSKNKSTPISNRTQRMFEQSSITTKQKDKSPSSSAQIANVKVLLSRKSIQAEPETKKDTAEKSSESTNNSIKKDSEQIVEESQSKPSFTKAITEASEKKDEDIMVNGTHKKKDAEKSLNQSSVKTKKQEALGEDKLEDTSIGEGNIKRDKEPLEANKEVVKRKRGRPRHPKVEVAKKQESSIVDTTITEQNLNKPDSDTEIIQDANIDNEEKPKRRSETVSQERALALLKMNIVGSDEFQNLPRKRNSNSIFASRANSTPKRTKATASENTKTKDKVTDTPNKESSAKEKAKISTEQNEPTPIKSDNKVGDSVGEINSVKASKKEEDLNTDKTVTDLQKSAVKVGEETKQSITEKAKVVASGGEKKSPSSKNSDTTIEKDLELGKNEAVKSSPAVNTRRSTSKRLNLENDDKSTELKRIEDEKEALVANLKESILKLGSKCNVNKKTDSKKEDEHLDGTKEINVNTNLGEEESNNKEKHGEEKVSLKKNSDKASGIATKITDDSDNVKNKEGGDASSTNNEDKCMEEFKTVIFDKKLGKIVKSTPVVNKTNEETVELKQTQEQNDDTFEVTSRSDTESGISLTIKKLFPKQSPEKTVTESSNSNSPSPSKRSGALGAFPKINDVRVALFRNNFNELSPKNIKKITDLNEVSPSKEADTETMEIPSQDSDARVSEADTETMNITAVSEVSLHLVLENTPDGKQALPSSPVSRDTPNRNNELMRSTFDISPIKSSERGKQKGKISPDIFASQKEPSQDIELKDLENDISFKADDVATKQTKQSEPEPPKLKGPSSRSAKLLNLVPQAQPIKTHKSILDPITCAPQVSSPTTERIKRMMMNCDTVTSVVPEMPEPVLNMPPKNILKFEKEVPSPLATPKVSILKRKMAETLDDGLSPCAKRKRVNFSDPPTTSEKIYFKEDKEKMTLRQRLYSKTTEVPDQPQDQHQFKDNVQLPLFEGIRPLEELVSADRVFHFTGAESSKNKSSESKNTDKSAAEELCKTTTKNSFLDPSMEKMTVQIFGDILSKYHLSPEGLTDLIMKMLNLPKERKDVVRNFIDENLPKEDLVNVEPPGNSSDK